MGIIVFGEGDLPLTKFIHIIHQLEKVRDADFLGTSIHAVAAGGAGNGFFRGNDFGDLFHKLPFFIRERLETVHVREIILHLLRCGHAGQHHRHVGQTGGEPHRPGRDRLVRPGFFQQFFRFRRDAGQQTAFDRLHDQHRLVVSDRGLVALPRLNLRILPVRIIFPLLKPATSSIIVLFTLQMWNDFTLPLIMLQSESKKTITTTVYSFFSAYSMRWDYALTSLVLSILPMIIFFLFMQKYIISGIIAGAVKG